MPSYAVFDGMFPLRTRFAWFVKDTMPFFVLAGDTAFLDLSHVLGAGPRPTFLTRPTEFQEAFLIAFRKFTRFAVRGALSKVVGRTGAP
jgi:hypothetical protein